MLLNSLLTTYVKLTNINSLLWKVIDIFKVKTNCQLSLHYYSKQQQAQYFNTNQINFNNL